MILDGYWKDRPDAEMKARILADWADTLEDWHQGDVLGALRKWRNENPNKKPNPGHILGLLKEARGRAESERMAISKPAPQPPRQEITGEERARRRAIAEELGVGFAMKPEGES